MKIKFSRGPMKDQRYEIGDSSCREYIVQEPRKRYASMYYTYDLNPTEIDSMYKRGSYVKSNVRLKDGTCVFEWMGWFE